MTFHVYKENIMYMRLAAIFVRKTIKCIVKDAYEVYCESVISTYCNAVYALEGIKYDIF